MITNRPQPDRHAPRLPRLILDRNAPTLIDLADWDRWDLSGWHIEFKPDHNVDLGPVMAALSADGVVQVPEQATTSTGPYVVRCVKGAPTQIVTDQGVVTTEPLEPYEISATQEVTYEHTTTDLAMALQAITIPLAQAADRDGQVLSDVLSAMEMRADAKGIEGTAAFLLVENGTVLTQLGRTYWERWQDPDR